jgi:AraC-like DNA-binding protein
VINQRFHKNFNDFINDYRIEEAKKMLGHKKTRDYKLLTIAYEVGFNSKTTFNVVFKKKVGMTPSQYRAACRESAAHRTGSG